ncbi:MAG: metal-sensing transcriptional repressor [Pygmaiobacter massiliensis]|nr:metal-sensing transcriptional repressor [Pygmaiobacter massiliensis]
MKADKARITRMIRTARGQLDGVLRMIEEDQYCVDISRQILAANAILRKTNTEILRAHLQGCVQDTFCCEDESEKQKKLDEMVSLLEAMSK